MIYIQERKTSKVPGITSVFLKFDYNKQLIDDIKSIPCFNFSKRTCEWEFPIEYLSMLLDIVCLYDDIDLKLCNYKVDEDVKYDLMKYKTKPFSYQEDGIQFGLNHDKWLLLDPPGLGKTLQIIYTAQELKRREKLEHCLIICGINTLKTNWKKEIEKHSHLSSMILGEKISSRGNITFGSVSERLAQLNKKIKEFFVITNIETLRNDDVIKAILKGPNKFDMIAIDECHVCKNASSEQGSNLLKLNAKY